MTLTKAQIAQVVAQQQELLHSQSHLRQGQALFIALHTLHPEVANFYRSTEADCFYRDSRIPTLLQQLEGTPS